MKLDARLKKLEEKVSANHGMWATFTMKHYEDSVERGKVKQRLLDEYVAQGNPIPLGCIYWKLSAIIRVNTLMMWLE
jgi:hypothetical protein